MLLFEKVPKRDHSIKSKFGDRWLWGNADTVQVVEVVAVEATKYQQAASDKVGAVSPPGTRGLADHRVHFLRDLLVHIQNYDILQVVAEPAPKNVYLVVEHIIRRAVSPARDEVWAFHNNLLPCQHVYVPWR